MNLTQFINSDKYAFGQNEAALEQLYEAISY